jgi:hypothetical protein
VLVAGRADTGAPSLGEQPVDGALDQALAVMTAAVLVQAHVDDARQAELGRLTEDVSDGLGPHGLSL